MDSLDQYALVGVNLVIKERLMKSVLKKSLFFVSRLDLGVNSIHSFIGTNLVLHSMHNQHGIVESRGESMPVQSYSLALSFTMSKHSAS